METYIRVCDECGWENSVQDDKCEKCGHSLFQIIPTVKQQEAVKTIKFFRRCKACGTINYFENNDDVTICKTCGNDELYKSPKESEETSDSISVCSKNENELSEKTAPETIQSVQTIQLIGLSDGTKLNIPITGAVLGRMGTVKPEYFSPFDYVSRIHAYVDFKNGNWYIKDCSSCGTKINGIKIAKGTYELLNNGDLISLANVHLKVNF